jgi:putative peptidoglycan lipid II flippase
VERQSVARIAGRMGVATLASRLLGVVREQIFAALFGASIFSDAFITAFRIPNLLRDLFAEGALSAAFVPTFSSTLAKQGAREAFRLANLVLSTLALLVGILVLAAMIFPQPIVEAIAPGFQGQKLELTVLATRIMLPFLLLVSLAAVCMGMLNSHDRYTTAAFAPAMFNAGTIATGIALRLAGYSDRAAVIGWSIGTLIGGAGQLGIQLVPLWKLGFRLRPRLDLAFRDPGLRRMAGLMGFAVVGLAATQVNLFVSTIFASTDERAISYLNYAFRVLYLPIGLFGVAAGTITAVRSGRAAAANDAEGMAASVRDSLRFLVLFTVPAAAGLMVLGRPIVRLLFERGRFGPEDTEATAAALALYGIGLLAYSSVKVFASAFYSLSKPYIPVLCSFAAVGTNVLFALLTFGELGFRGLALGTSLGALVNCALLAAVFHARHGLIRRDLLVLLAKVLIASAVMAAGAAWISAQLESRLPMHGLTTSLLAAGLPIAAGLGLFVAACRLLGIAEVRSLWPVRRP